MYGMRPTECSEDILCRANALSGRQAPHQPPSFHLEELEGRRPGVMGREGNNQDESRNPWSRKQKNDEDE